MSGWEKNVRRVVPYVPGEQPKIPGLIKLNTNENPYPPSPLVKKAIEETDEELLRLYPDPAASVLTAAYAKRYGLKETQVFTGVGSDDVLAMCFLAFFNGEQEILFPDVTYSFYETWAGLLRIPFRKVPLKEGFVLDPEDYFGDGDRKNGGVIFPNPNAPTGALLERESVEQIIRHNPDSVVIVDEAYIDFGGSSVTDLIDTYDNLLVVQTMSKSRSLAGLRIGSAFGSEKLISYLQDVKYSVNSYTMNRLSIAAGAAALEDEAYFEETVRRIIETREDCKRKLRELGFHFPDSRANFIFASHESVSAEVLFRDLRNSGILVRYFRQPGIDNYLRITIGTPEQMETLITFLEGYLRKH